MAETNVDKWDPTAEGEPNDRQKPAVEGELIDGLKSTVEGNPGKKLDIATVIIHGPRSYGTNVATFLSRERLSTLG